MKVGKQMQTITFIGNGTMALSIAEGLKHKYDIEVVGRSMERLDAFEAALDKKVEKFLLDDFDISGKTLLLCVKPGNLESEVKRWFVPCRTWPLQSVLP